MNKIAIIEDDIDICNMIAKFLENNKYIVHYALNGAEGIELCKSLVHSLSMSFLFFQLKGHGRKKNKLLKIPVPAFLLFSLFIRSFP